MEEQVKKWMEMVASESKKESAKRIRLMPYMEGVKQLREKGYTFKDISKKLEEHGVEASPSYLGMVYREMYSSRRKKQQRRDPNAPVEAAKKVKLQPTDANVASPISEHLAQRQRAPFIKV